MISLPSQFKDADLSKLSVSKKKELVKLLEALEYKRNHNKVKQYFPDEGPLRRELYKKHIEFFEAGKYYIERLLMAANRVGKTLAGAYETSVHQTGDYEPWWPGKEFSGPTDFWAAGFTSETTRDVVQFAMMGPMTDLGSGMIPKDLIKDYTLKRGVPDAIDTVLIRHGAGGDVNAGESTLGFKQYKQGRKAFEGTKKHGIWFDEESGMDVYNEALLRVTSAKDIDYKEGDDQETGLVYTTFTPLEGLSELVMSFLPQHYSFSDA